MNQTVGFAVFEREGTHSLCALLGEFKHVFAIVRDPDSGVWISHNWLSGRVEVDYVGLDGGEVRAHYESLGAIVVPVLVDRTPVPRAAWPVYLNNCVGHTKQVLNAPSWAFTPCQLKSTLERRKGADAMNSIADWMALPGKALIAPEKPKPPAAPPPPPTELDARSSSARQRQRAAASAQQGAAGAIRNVGGSLGVSTSTATTGRSTLLGG